MSDFNDMLNKAKDFASSAADTVSDVATDLYEKGKDKVKETRLKTSLRGCYRTLGEMVYNEAKGVEVDPSRKEEIVKEIDSILADLSSLSE